jgi:hypothetical protein
MFIPADVTRRAISAELLEHLPTTCMPVGVDEHPLDIGRADLDGPWREGPRACGTIHAGEWRRTSVNQMWVEREGRFDLLGLSTGR